MKRTLVNLTFFFCFFPFMRLFPIQAETQPIAGLIALMIIFLYGVKKSVFSITLMWLIFVITGYCVVSIILRPYLFLSIILHSMAYFIPLFVFLSLYDKMDLLSPRLYFVVLFIWLVVGIIQYFSLFGFLKPALDAVLGRIIARYTSVPLGGAKGVLFFGPEPAASSSSIILFMLTAVFFHATRKISGAVMWLALSASVFVLFLNKSGTGMLLFILFPLGFFMVYIVGFVRGLKSFILPREVIYVPFYVIFILIAIWFSVVSLRKHFGYGNRIFEITPVLWKKVVVQRDVSVVALTSVGGGFRYPVMYVGYRSLGQNYALGHGVASWLTDFDRIARSCGVFLENLPLIEHEKKIKVVKPGAYAATIALDTGLPGLFFLMLFLSLFLFSGFKTKMPLSVSSSMWSIFLISAFKILLSPPLTLPMAWLGLCYVYHIKNSVLSHLGSAE